MTPSNCVQCGRSAPGAAASLRPRGSRPRVHPHVAVPRPFSPARPVAASRPRVRRPRRGHRRRGGGYRRTRHGSRAGLAPPRAAAVLDKEPGVGMHQTGRSSGVLHSGLYYAPGSLKARLCVQGAAALAAYCDERGIPVTRCGMVVVATSPEELPRLAELERRGRANGVAGLEAIGPERLRGARSRMPRKCGRSTCPVTGRGRLRPRRARARGGPGSRRRRAVARLRGDGDRGAPGPGRAPRGDRRRGGGPQRRLLCRRARRPAGASRRRGRGPRGSCRSAATTTSSGPSAATSSTRSSTPCPILPSRSSESTRPCGRTGRSGSARTPCSPSPARATAASICAPATSSKRCGRPGFGSSPADTGAWGQGRWCAPPASGCSWRRPASCCPSSAAGDVVAGPAGIRAQALAPDGSLVDDFVLERRPGVVHVRNAPSPGATSSLMIAETVATMAEEAFGIGGFRP